MPKKKGEETAEITGEQAVEEIVENIKKNFGQESVVLLGKSETKKREIISTGSYLLDQATGTGGYVCGKIVEIYGLQSSGKSTLALQAVSECQKLNKKAAYFDLENGLDINYAENIGVKSQELIFPYPSCGEQAFDMLIELIRENVDLIVVDSVSNLVPRSQLEANLEKQRIGSHAALMSSGLRKLKPELMNKKTIIIFINQMRENISTSYFASPRVTTGGMSLGFDADLRIQLKKREELKKNEEIVGIEVEAKVMKNKLAPHGKVANLEIIFPYGVQKSREILDLAVSKEIVQKSGNWYSYQGNKLGNGREAALGYLTENPQVYSEIEQVIVQESGLASQLERI